MKQHKDFTKLVAEGIYFTDSHYRSMCAFCEVSPHSPHAEDCPTAQARELLKEDAKEQWIEFNRGSEYIHADSITVTDLSNKGREYIRCEYCNKLMERRMLRHHQLHSKVCLKLQAILLQGV